MSMSVEQLEWADAIALGVAKALMQLGVVAPKEAKKSTVDPLGLGWRAEEVVSVGECAARLSQISSQVVSRQRLSKAIKSPVSGFPLGVSQVRKRPVITWGPVMVWWAKQTATVRR